MEWKWIVLAGAVWSRIITTGTVVCMGVFLDDVATSFSHVDIAQLSFVFAVASGLLEGMGIIVRILITKFEARYLIFVGALFAAGGLIATSMTSDYWILLIGFGIMNGIGQAMARFIMPTAVGYVFDDAKRPAALAVMNAGDGVGGVLFPVLLAWLIDTFSWRNGMLIVGALVLNLCVCAVTVPRRLFLGGKKSKQHKLPLKNEDENNGKTHDIDGNLATKAPSVETSFSDDKSTVGLCPNVLLFYLNIISHSVGYFVFMVFIYSDMKQSKVDPATVSRVVSVIGGVSIIGRLGVSVIRNWRFLPRWSIYAIGHIIRGCAVLCTLWAPEDTHGRVLWYTIICAVYGFTDGITGALIAIVVVDLFGLARFATVFGGEMMVMGIGATAGVPVAGWMRDYFQSYTKPFIFSGCAFLVAGAVLVPLVFTRKYYELERVQKSKTGQQNLVQLVDVKPIGSV